MQDICCQGGVETSLRITGGGCIRESGRGCAQRRGTCERGSGLGTNHETPQHFGRKESKEQLGRRDGNQGTEPWRECATWGEGLWRPGEVRAAGGPTVGHKVAHRSCGTGTGGAGLG